jgi:hypothetical protein
VSLTVDSFNGFASQHRKSSVRWPQQNRAISSELLTTREVATRAVGSLFEQRPLDKIAEPVLIAVLDCGCRMRRGHRVIIENRLKPFAP